MLEGADDSKLGRLIDEEDFHKTHKKFRGEERMNENIRRERGDLILAPGEYAYILDGSKGNINVATGPMKTSLSETDRAVVFDDKTRKFVEATDNDKIKQLNALAPEGWYIVLKNPSKASENEHPGDGKLSDLPTLKYGQKINIPGPVTFALWPRQVAKVIEGHHLRSNQYLVARVYDEEAAKDNWGKAVVKPQVAGVTTDNVIKEAARLANVDGEEVSVTAPLPQKSPKKLKQQPKDMPELTMGKLIIIKGTEVSFYLPPTGIEIVPETNIKGQRFARDAYATVDMDSENANTKFIRNAVTLERLEYCILLDEDGNKRYVEGPKVVFPKPTETFVNRQDSQGKLTRKFTAIELNELKGIYVKVIADYEEGNKKYKAGDELFITGSEQRIYYPRTEHAIIKYDGKKAHYAIAIPKGEARYVLDRNSGEISLKKGPCMFLPNPINEVVVRRILSEKEVETMFPGNHEALMYNSSLKEINEEENRPDNFVSDRMLRTKSAITRNLTLSNDSSDMLFGAAMLDAAELNDDSFAAGDEVERKNKFTPPRSITLDTKYDGAVSVNVWTGYAVKIIDKTGRQRVEVGPKAILLEYDEKLEVMELSTGKPKRTDRMLKTAYLRINNNTISDVITVETKDLCEVDVKVSYKVNFEGEPDKWFEVENYVKYLTDRMRSIIRNNVKRIGIQTFNDNYIEEIRNIVLGSKPEAAEGKERKQRCRKFTENGMVIYDVDVLDISMTNSDIGNSILETQHKNIEKTLLLNRKRKELEISKETEKIDREILEIEASIEKKRIEIKVELDSINCENEMEGIRSEAIKNQEILEAKLNDAKKQKEIALNNLSIEVARSNAELENLQGNLDAQVKSTSEQMKVLTPELVKALNDFSDKDLVTKLSENLSILQILGKGKQGLFEIIGSYYKNSPLEKAVTSLKTKKSG